MAAINNELLVEANKILPEQDPQRHFDAVLDVNRAHPHVLDVEIELLTSYFFLIELKTTPKKEKERLLKEAERFAAAMIDYYDENSVGWATGQKWTALVVGSLSDYMPVMEKVERSYQIRDFGLRAQTVLADDPKIPHLLGRWCLTVASVGWLERKLAAALFAEPPRATYEEAVQHFLRAEALDPTFIRNYHYLAETYTKMGRKADAKATFQRMLDNKSVVARTDLEREYVEEAKRCVAK